jgi:hypothetical protein
VKGEDKNEKKKKTARTIIKQERKESLLFLLLLFFKCITYIHPATWCLLGWSETMSLL